MSYDSILSDVAARLDVIEARESVLQALLPETGRRERVMAAATQVPVEQALAGHLVGIKDILHVEGMVTGAGTRLPTHLFAGDEAACVRRLREAGAIVLGKTVTTEFAFFEPGLTTNPHDPGHTPGGSSSGSAAAVAAGYCQIALGTQTVGSVIRPAAFCGVFGYKPTYGRIPTDGLLLCSPSVDTIGLFATDPVMAQRTAAVLVDDWSPTASAPRRPVLGVPRGPYLEQASPDALAAFETQLAQLRQVEIEIRDVDGVFDDIADINTRHSDVQAAEMAFEHSAWMAQHLDLYRPRTRQILERGQQVTPAQLEAGRNGRAQLREHLAVQMSRSGIDAWICPSATGPAPFGLESTGDPVMNLPWTHAGTPVANLPAGWVDHLPVGLQLVADFGQDEALLTWSEILSAALWPLVEPGTR
ncbi:MAG: amidase [Gemmatimonadetes bacterium]|nr:amidase [Gemmatimonadota bacterium]MBT7860276.1 amidase [Gemmatimonadota bacterium]